jgi:spermidine synthase
MITLAECKSRFGVITISRTKSAGSLTYYQDGFPQSEADGNSTSLASYIHAIYDLLCQIGSRNIAMIGCAGGTLATMLWKNGCRVTVVDIDPLAIFLARKYFGLPDGVNCLVADGCEFLAAAAARYDAIVLDAFAAGRIPSQFRSVEFFTRVRGGLTGRGALFANVHVTDDLDSGPDCMASTMAEVWPEVRLLDDQGRTNRNAIVMAGAVRPLVTPVLRIEPQISGGEIAAELRSMKFRTWRARS